MLWQEKKKGFVSFRLDNRGEIGENFRELLVAYNSTEEDVMLELPAGEWRWLVNGADSHCWEQQEPVSGTSVSVKGISAIVLGRV